jgi:NADPH:quinone reductase
MEELPRGLVALERRETWGKVILHVKDEHSHDGAKL